MRFFGIWVLFVTMAEFERGMEEIERSFHNISPVDSDLEEMERSFHNLSLEGKV